MDLLVYLNFVLRLIKNSQKSLSLKKNEEKAGMTNTASSLWHNGILIPYNIGPLHHLKSSVKL